MRVPRNKQLNSVEVERCSNVRRLVPHVGLERLVVEAHDKKSAVAIAYPKDAPNELGNSLRLVGIDPTLYLDVQALTWPRD
jgi:hypothetical protein